MPTYHEYYQPDPRDKAAEALLIIEEIRQANDSIFDRPEVKLCGLDIVEAKYRKILRGE